MNDDDLFGGLKKAAKRDPSRASIPRWERLAKGDASVEERAELEAIAREDGDDAAIEALAHVDDAAVAKVTSAIESASKSPEIAARGASPARRGIARAVVMTAGALAIAAGVALFLSRSGNGAGELPVYELAVSGGDQSTRAGDTPAQGPVKLGPNAELRILLRPEHDVEALDVRLFLVRDGVASPWSAPFRVTPAGVVQIIGPASQLLTGENGRREILVALGRPGTVPADPKALANGSGTFRVVHVVVDVVGR